MGWEPGRCPERPLFSGLTGGVNPAAGKDGSDIICDAMEPVCCSGITRRISAVNYNTYLLRDDFVDVEMKSSPSLFVNNRLNPPFNVYQ